MSGGSKYRNNRAIGKSRRRRLPQYSIACIALLLLISTTANAGAPSFNCGGDATRLMFPLDNTFELVDFCGDGATGAGPAVCPDQHNDDDSATVPLPFTFNLYGDLYDTAFINTNGNISFVTSFAEFSSSAFPNNEFIMVAPFWTDVDTGTASAPLGDVWMKLVDGNGDNEDDTLIVTWENVGYFDTNGELRNTFQVAISDGSNPQLGAGNNVCFSYDNMCWTTGDASDGVAGFAGIPATAGANRGDGTNFFQIGRYDQPGTAFDGPFGANDGVDSLDNQVFCFSTVTTTNNIAPIATNVPPRGFTIDVDSAGQLATVVSFLSPEQGQFTTVSVVDLNNAAAQGLDIQTTGGNIAEVSLQWLPNCSALGRYEVILEATDDFSPPGITTVSLIIEVNCSAAPEYLRGDCGVDGSIDLFDAITTLFFLFLGGEEPLCMAACDADDDSAVDLIDAVHTLTFLFGGGTPPEAPFPDCGPGNGTCIQYLACP